jgi:hypothetical protein
MIFRLFRRAPGGKAMTDQGSAGPAPQMQPAAELLPLVLHGSLLGSANALFRPAPAARPFQE